jgi:hypothetical protein
LLFPSSIHTAKSHFLSLSLASALDEQLEEEEEEIDILRFPGRLAQNPPQPFPYLDPSLTASYEDEDNDDADSEAEGEVQGLTALYRVGE